MRLFLASQEKVVERADSSCTKSKLLSAERVGDEPISSRFLHTRIDCAAQPASVPAGKLYHAAPVSSLPTHR